MKITIQKIAELSGVSMMTVSRVFDPNKAGMVKESTRKKILEVAKQYNYHPVMIGKSFTTGKTYKIGLILDTMIADLSSPTFSRFVEAVCSELQLRGYTLILLHAKDVKKYEGANVRDLLESKVADGYILGKPMIFEQVRKTLAKTPVVLLSPREDGHPENLDVVQIRRPIISVYRKLWEMIPPELRHSVAIVSPEDHYYPGESRAELIASAAPEGVEVTKFYSDPQPGFLVDRANAVAVAEEHFEELRKFKVIWAINDLYAMGVTDVFRRNGLFPGKDFYVIGFDNLEPSMPEVEPFLTTCDHRWDEIGRLAADTILQLVAGKNIAEKDLTVEPEVIRRTSL